LICRAPAKMVELVIIDDDVRRCSLAEMSLANINVADWLNYAQTGAYALFTTSLTYICNVFLMAHTSMPLAALVVVPEQDGGGEADFSL
jgi:hypothetical protein